jgi:phosphate starvation-inducible PhoH-like protein
MARPKRNKKNKNEIQQIKQKNQQNQQIKARSILKPKTKNQEDLIITMAENTITLATGPAGCGKTKLAVAYGIEKLLNKEYKRLVITRPVVESGESLGYLPGSFSEKLDPYLQPIYYELSHYISKQELESFINNGINRRGQDEIIIAPLAYMRGMNYHDSYMVLDECQNCTKEQIKLFITRVGFNSKAVLVGDDKQSDLPNGKSGIYYWCDKLKGIKDVATFQLNKTDIIRNPVISDILHRIGE